MRKLFNILLASSMLSASAFASHNLSPQEMSEAISTLADDQSAEIAVGILSQLSDQDFKQVMKLTEENPEYARIQTNMKALMSSNRDLTLADLRTAVADGQQTAILGLPVIMVGGFLIVIATALFKRIQHCQAYAKTHPRAPFCN